MTCSGGTPGQTVKGNITVFLPVNITNKLLSDNSTDAVISVEGGSVQSQLLSQSSLTFAGITATVSPGGGVNIRISNLRAAVNQLNGLPMLQVAMAMDGLGSLSLGNNRPTAAIISPGLLATYSQSGIRCVGSPAPSTLSMSSLFAKGTRFASTRFTEGFPASFQVRGAGEDSGTRILLRYAGLPAGARLFVPDLVAGSDTVQPTAGGDLGLAQASGQYAVGSGTLLLARVLATDANGAGGVPPFNASAPGSGTVSLDSASEVSISSGSAFVVYEVVDSNPGILESAQFPTFISLAPITDGTSAVVQEALSLAPVSTVNTASANAPIPRFAAANPPSDCPALRDCEAAYFPSLVVDAPPIQFSAIAGGTAMQPPGYIRIRNEGGGLLNWTVSVVYKSGADWLTLYDSAGFNNGTVQVWARPQKLPAGTYQATLIVDAGPLSGTRMIPVTLVVTALPTINPPAPAVIKPGVTSVTNAADYHPGPMVPGSLAVAKGANLAGKNVSVTFDGSAAKLLSANDTEIYLVVPADLGAKTSARMVVTADDRVSDAQVVALAAVAPAIFGNGVANADGSTNGPNNPAPVGGLIVVYLTGLPANGGGAWVKIHDRDNLEPVYAGAAPTLTGVQQVNVAIPADLPYPMVTEVKICANAADGNPVCSWPSLVNLGQ